MSWDVLKLVEHLPAMPKTFTSIPTTEERERRKGEEKGGTITCKIDSWGQVNGSLLEVMAKLEEWMAQQSEL